MKKRNLVRAGAAVLAALGASAVFAQAVVVAPVPPPPVRFEPVPVARPGYVWDAGHWLWRAGAYAWVPGHWQVVRPGYRWMPGHWVARGATWCWMPGHWA
ncbi:YXWGXW repeat-containing protein [Paraburkholderia silviterrae]|uniref:YXWGXW repeat-containing protein n=1 Tax=Paraburkholderia silviterrae TaxID=2528715 RepID=A0A4R5M376_9BURK|nr:YXWGXW repeat-containing protein [Paraburkholderia silviterrae]TDG20049.1 hypothetical protein EYW47_28260 [Paraburkholderia silviterrae]